MNVRFILAGSCSVQAETRGQTGVFVGRLKSAGLYLAAAGILEKERLLHESGMWMSVYEMCFIYVHIHLGKKIQTSLSSSLSIVTGCNLCPVCDYVCRFLLSCGKRDSGGQISPLLYN